MKSLYLISIIFMPLFFVHAHAKDELSGQGIMAVSKMAGACGILYSMIHFQKTTKLPGGNEFVTRFWATEAARLGLTMQQYSDRCNNSLSTYQELWNALGELQ